ncbi:hypothetical protein C7C46_10000 [Streptomyces tateyamensis]|uniref:Uncharacterized protein n=1 Tax=Streptomyces tateyamensis TaxID=565073 RepID=A0A2V4NRU6_9ACTN|nr:hypothetical protein [Streptomyces tateyamensis]PYC82678.1 hypothetical protein C7C46_10000 [Streptomyces tateyamensis]
MIVGLRQIRGSSFLSGGRRRSAGLIWMLGRGGACVGEVHHGRGVGLRAVQAVEASAGHRGGRAGGGALEPDGPVWVGSLLELGEVGAALGQALFQLLIEVPDGLVVQASGRLRECLRDRGAGEGAVDEEGTEVGALNAALVLLVVECELVAQAAGGLLEVLGLLVGVGAVGGQQAYGKTERGQRGERVDGVGPDALAGGVQDGAEGELGMLAHTLPNVSVADGVATAGGDQEGRAVTEGSLVAAAAEVPAGGEFDGGQAASVAGLVVPGRDGGGVGADVAVPPLEEAAALGEPDGDQHQAVADLLQQGPAPQVLRLVVLPGAGLDCGVGEGEPSPAVGAGGVQGRGQAVEGAVDAAAERGPCPRVVRIHLWDVEPAAGRGLELVEQDPARVRKARALVVVQGQQQSDRHSANGQAARARTARQLGVDQVEDPGALQQEVELADLGIRDLGGCVGQWPGPAVLDLLRVPPGARDGHAGRPRRSRIAVASSSGGTRCW